MALLLHSQPGAGGQIIGSEAERTQVVNLLQNQCPPVKAPGVSAHISMTVWIIKECNLLCGNGERADPLKGSDFVRYPERARFEI
jgi:hypothetical protein